VESLAFNLEVQFPQAFGYLLQVQPDRHVKFSHSTIKELLTSSAASESTANHRVLSKYLIQESDIDAELAKCCIIILSFRDFVRLRDIAREALTDRIHDFLLSALQTDQNLANFSFSEYDEDADGGSRKSLELNSGDIKELTRTMSQADLDPQTHTLFSYCVSYWNYHCSQAATNPEVETSLTRFVLLRQSYFFHLVAMLLGMARVHRTAFWKSVDQFKRVPPLHFILRIGDHPAVVWNLIQQGQNINSLDCHGWTPLEWALLEGRKASLDTLLAQDSIEVNGVVGCPLVLSCKADASLDVIERLLHDPRIDINAKSAEGWSVLHWCLSRQKYRPVVDHLLSRKDLDINMTDGRDITYLEQLFEEGELETVAIKLVSRADVPMNWFAKTPKRRKPAWIEAKSYDAESADTMPSSYLSRAGFLQWYRIEDLILEVDPLQAVLIEEDGMDLLARYAFHGIEQRLSRLLEQLPANIFADHKERGAELMLLGAQQDWEQLVEKLSSKFSVSQISSDKNGRTIAHWACELRWKSIPAWISSSPSKKWLDQKANDGKTALHVAAEHRNYLACKCLLEAGASYLVGDKSGKLPIHIAAEEGHRAIVYLLLQCPVLDYGKDVEGRTLLHYLSMWYSDTFLRECLWAFRPSLNVVDHHHRTPLHYAAMFDNCRAMGVLLELGANPNAKDGCNATPLHRALLEGSLPCVELLIRHGADPELLDRFCRNSLHLSILSGVPGLLDYVLGIIR
jgi:ankyrin repeat protein